VQEVFIFINNICYFGAGYPVYPLIMKFSIFFLMLIFSVPVVAQRSFTLSSTRENQGSDIQDNQILELYEFYYHSVGVVDKLINGKEYIPYYFRSKLKPLLKYGQDRKSTLTLGGRTYKDISLQYDTYTDDLIYTDTTRIHNNIAYQIALNKDPVDAFEMFFGSESMQFKNFNGKRDKNFNLKEGFYEVVYDGRSKYIIKHQSAIIEKEGVDEYFYRPAGFIMIKGGYTRIRSSQKLLKMFGDRSGEVRKFVRDSGTDISKADKKQIARILEYYDNLISTE